MSEFKYTCFVIMPFSPELHYFYLYLQYHIEKQHPIQCVRGDSDVLTSLLLEKIIDYIEAADVIIADITGRNPNVFYELGVAHTLSKPVVLITQDANAPTDIAGYERIRYELDKDVEFLNKLDNALTHVFLRRYEDLYRRAEAVYYEFKIAKQVAIEKVSEEEFISRVKDAERTEKIPSMHEELRIARFVLPRIINDATDTAIIEQIDPWLFEKWRLAQ
jgi:nucleoside 2-deoxyribosyltransferase